MPIYEYYCSMCNKKWKEMHSSEEENRNCDSCNNICKRNVPSNSTVKINQSASTAGQRVEKYIEDTKEAVKEQLAEARREYKP